MLATPTRAFGHGDPRVENNVKYEAVGMIHGLKINVI
jgi:hypothetical protein